MAERKSRDVPITSGVGTETDPSYTYDKNRDVAYDRDRDYDDTKPYRRVLSAGTLKGDRVRNSAGEDLGKIEEIMLDVPSGRVAYAVLSFGGFLGMGDKLFAVPWHALTLDEQQHEFVLNVDKNTLENAPGFDKDNWPDMADPDWGSQINSYYGVKSDIDRPREKTLRGGGGM